MTAPTYSGSVALVGAGPGDPELLTRRAERLIRAADVIVYDALVNAEVLALAPLARRIFVGKRAGRPSVRQAFINRLLVRNARRGLRVVRLKGGDPFVFGRGGEEALALVAAGLPFEVVPGVSTAIAAAGLAGIPVTHRGLASAFVVVSGHDETAYRPLLERLAPGCATVVVLMGLSRIRDIAMLLLERGWQPSIPVAVVLGSSGATESNVTAQLGDLARGMALAPDGRPGTIVIGEVVRLRRRLMNRCLLMDRTISTTPDVASAERLAAGVPAR